MNKGFNFFLIFFLLIFAFLFLPFSTDAWVNPNDSRWIKNLSKLSSENNAVADVANFAPQIAISGNTLHVSWIGKVNINGTNYYRLYYTRSSNRGITWETPRILFEVDDYTQLIPSSRWLAVDGNNVHIFVNGNYPSYPLLYFRSTDGGQTFREPKVIDNTSHMYDYDINSIYTSASNGKVAISYKKNREMMKD